MNAKAIEQFQPGVIVAGRYRIVAPLGAGGMGDVYRAVQEPLGREVALKVIRAENQTPELCQRFHSEVRTMAAVKHRGVATVFDFGTYVDGTLFYAMELIHGSNLRELLEREGPLPWSRVHAIAVQVASALAEVHAAGIMHRDLKPANIMISEGRVTIVDFGLARQVRQGAERLTEVGIVIGTPAYLAPEQAMARGQDDARSDLYSLGAVMYEMLSGRPPFVADTPVALLLKHMSEAHEPLRRLVGEHIPAEVDALLVRLLAKDPAERPVDGAALLGELMTLAAPELEAGEPATTRSPAPGGGLAPTLASMKVGSTAMMTAPVDAGSGGRPTIAVLPFTARSEEDEEFAEGLAEDVITDLAKLSELVVIDSRSSFVYKDRQLETKKIGGELGVRYIVSGSVRRSGPRVRLTVSLVDVHTGEGLWTERFDRMMEDVFDVQDELTEQIVSALDVKLHAGEQARLWRRSLRTQRGREAFYRGIAAYRVLARANLQAALASFRRLIEVEPDSPLGHAHASQCHWFLAWLDGVDRPDEHLAHAREAVHKALALDPECAIAHSVLAHVHITDGRHHEALEAARRSAELCPNGADVLANYGEILVIWGHDDEALAVLSRALRNSPSAAPFYLQMLGAAYRGLGRFHEAIAVLRQAVARYPDHAILRFTLITNLGAAGLVAEAQAQARALRSLDPRFDMQALAMRIPFVRREQNLTLLGYLIKGGVVEEQGVATAVTLNPQEKQR
ncbi:MAG: protein kinase [Myxococcales bacterium]|nr:protein kinase [Myxococcales bacterium]